jgi:hypothetical protein
VPVLAAAPGDSVGRRLLMLWLTSPLALITGVSFGWRGYRLMTPG